MEATRLAFLYEATKVLPQNDCGRFIRSQLIAKCYAIDNVNRPAQNFKPAVVCRACGIQLSDVPPKVEIKASKKPNRNIRRLLRETDRNKLSRSKKHILDCFQRKNYQKLITTCKLCNKKHVTKIEKPKIVPVKIPEKEPVSKRSLKRKRRDIYSGLNKEAVLSVLPTQQLTKSNNPTKSNGIQNYNPNNSVIIVPDTPKNNMTPKRNLTQNNKPQQKSKKNKIKVGKVEKNEVLKKTEKNLNKNKQRMKNLRNILQEKPTQSNSLAAFLKSI